MQYDSFMYLDIRPTFISSPLSESVREHESVILTCTSGPSQPFATVSWEKDGEAIKEKNDVTAQNILKDRNATSSTLLLKNVSIFRDTAYYRCVALNPLLLDVPQVSPRARLTVLRKFVILAVRKFVIVQRKFVIFVYGDFFAPSLSLFFADMPLFKLE